MPYLSENQSHKLLAALIHERTGLQFEDSRTGLLVDKLAPLISEGRFDSVMDYYYYLRYDENAEDEWRRVQSALAVNESYFWREVYQLQAVAEIIVPRLQNERPDLPVRIWHAACATGEEPYSMAMLLDQAGLFDRGAIEIMATDFNLNALEQAQTGIFRQRSFRQLPTPILERYFTPLGPGKYRICDTIRSRVRYAYRNLMDESVMKLIPGYDIIFCRNAFIYFSTSAIQQVIGRFYRLMNERGYLFVAAAESLLRWPDLYELVEVGNAFAYQKRRQA